MRIGAWLSKFGDGNVEEIFMLETRGCTECRIHLGLTPRGSIKGKIVSFSDGTPRAEQ